MIIGKFLVQSVEKVISFRVKFQSHCWPVNSKLYLIQQNFSIKMHWMVIRFIFCQLETWEMHWVSSAANSLSRGP